MKAPGINADEFLKSMAAEAVKQHEQIRTAVRDLTLEALQMRELSLKQINSVVRNISAGVNAGVGDSKLDTGKALSDALAGMDDALLKVVEANKITLQKLTEGGASFEDSSLKKGLKQLESFEEKFLDSVKQASQKASEQVQEQWKVILDKIPRGGTATGAEVTETLRTQTREAQTAARSTREAGLKMVHTLSQNYATLVSGVLIGLSDALQHDRSEKPR
jgi:O6-methylguanine-DNA--protein-cysteine methyltransferase